MTPFSLSEVEGAISGEEIKDVFRWRNEVCERVVGKVIKIAKKHDLPLVFNSNYGHIANMSPNIAGPCEYKFDGPKLNLMRLEDRSLTASSKRISETAHQLDYSEIIEKPRSLVEAATAGKYGKIKSLGRANEL